jgi:mannose-6-phosphate isomerase-like protein (cupin superfamily)
MKYSALIQELLSFQRYDQNEIVGIRDSLDIFIQDKMTFGEWVNSYKDYSTVKVEGIESIPSVLRRFKRLNPKNIHMFITQKTGKSFNWHKDSVNVYLYVVRGQKIVHLKNKRHIVSSGQGVFIPKNHLHKVFSKAGTLALSVGY